MTRRRRVNPRLGGGVEAAWVDASRNQLIGSPLVTRCLGVVATRPVRVTMSDMMCGPFLEQPLCGVPFGRERQQRSSGDEVEGPWDTRRIGEDMPSEARHAGTQRS